jgi:queuine/archaeosine tRNA-ribosyltransferase
MTMARPKEIVLGNANLPTPVFFPSISTIKTALTPVQYLSTLHSLRNLKKQFLVSAFDLSRSSDGDEIAQCLIAAQAADVTVLMDSGNYESYWKDEQADWRQSDFHDVLRRFTYTFAFGFDEQKPPMDEDSHVKLVIKRWQQDQNVAGDRVIVPIVHGTAEALPNLCARIAQETQVPMIAVAERRLGDGVFERTRSVVTLRERLDSIGRYVGLHLLGTGNPTSIALYSWAGADSFDGLEWCQTAVDHDTGLLFHLSQSDFFRQQTAWGDEDISFHSHTLAHNLTFYADWMQRLRQAVYDGNVINFCRFNFPPRVFRQCAAALKWEVSE